MYYILILMSSQWPHNKHILLLQYYICTFIFNIPIKYSYYYCALFLMCFSQIQIHKHVAHSCREIKVWNSTHSPRSLSQIFSIWSACRYFRELFSKSSISLVGDSMSKKSTRQNDMNEFVSGQHGRRASL